MIFLANKLRGASKSSTKIEYVGGKTFTRGGSASSTTTVPLTDLTGGIGTQPQEGDIVIASVNIGSYASNYATSQLPSGYTQIAALYGNNNYDNSHNVSYKIMGATPDTSIVIPATISDLWAQTVTIQVFRNVDIINPLDVTPTTSILTATALPNPPAITPITAGAVIVVCGATAYYYAALTNNELTSFLSIQSINDTYDSYSGSGYFEWVSGAFDPVAFGGTNQTSYAATAVTMALRPK